MYYGSRLLSESNNELGRGHSEYVNEKIIYNTSWNV